MFGLNKTRSHEPSPYATRADFCRIFQRDVDNLYLLSLLLTGDHSVAEQCFVGGLHMSHEGNPVFKEWAESWARRTIIRNAIRMIRPRPREGSADSAARRTTVGAVSAPAEIAAVIELPAFERFAFIMSVLERYSDQECSLLLSCTRGEVIAARTRALQRVGRAMELQRKVVSIASENDAPRDDSGSIPQVEGFGWLRGITASRIDAALVVAWRVKKGRDDREGPKVNVLALTLAHDRPEIPRTWAVGSKKRTMYV